MFLSFAGFAFIFFWFGSRNMFIYIYLNLFKFISERFVIFFHTILIFQASVHLAHIAKPWLALCLPSVIGSPLGCPAG